MINHLWQSSCFAVGAGLLTLALRNNRAKVRYWLWLSASLKFLIPFSLLVSLGSHWQYAPVAQKIATPAVSLVVTQIGEPFSESVSFAPSAPGTIDWKLALWACGFAAIAMVRLRGWLGIRAAVRASTSIEMAMPVAVRSSPGLLEPGVAGLWRPILLLPAGIAERLSPPQLEAVLAHEMCHVRRRDNLFAAMHMIVEAVFWFHPFVWWIGARLVEERERACDEEVVLMGREPRVYAEAIVNVCKLYTESPLVCVSGITGSNLKKRIEAIMMDRIALRLNFAKKTALAVAGMTALAAPIVIGIMRAPAIRAQSAGAPKFEVASIRLCKDGESGGRGGTKSKTGGGGGESSPGRLNTGCMVLVDDKSLGLIQRAYVRFAGGRGNPMGIVPIKGGPDWIHSERYSINARAEGRTSLETMQGPMMQALLEDRFKLKIRREAREVPVYALTVGKDGPKLKSFQEGSCTPVPPPTLPRQALPPGQTYCKIFIAGLQPAVEAQGSTLGEFSKMLSLVMDRPVIDRTGLAGKFDIHLEFAIDDATSRLRPSGDVAAAVPTASDPAGPSIFAAIQQQLGLKLEPSKGPSEFLVIDHVERPSGN